jgi:hypothetical protein
MSDKCLQVKGDPSVRDFLFQQSRVENLFDTDLDRIYDIVYTFSCDGAYYNDHKTVFEKLESFAANDPDKNVESHLIVANA